MGKQRSDHVVEHLDVEREINEPILDVLLAPNRRQQKSRYKYYTEDNLQIP